jgi:hypothetical protein
VFDILDFSFKDTADDVSVGIPFQVVFLRAPFSSRATRRSSFSQLIIN